MSAPPPAAEARLLQTGIRLEQATLAWNVIEAAVALAAGWLASSIALVGFGLDSVIETLAAGVVLLHLLARRRGQDGARLERNERRTLRFVGLTFLALAAYVAWEAGAALLGHHVPASSPIGLGLAAASLLVMPWLAVVKMRTGRALGSRALVADGKETLACAGLSLALLLGLGLNSLFGWWWADPVAALAMVPLLVREGYEALAERGCHAPGGCTAD